MTNKLNKQVSTNNDGQLIASWWKKKHYVHYRGARVQSMHSVLWWRVVYSFVVGSKCALATLCSL